MGRTVYVRRIGVSTLHGLATTTSAFSLSLSLVSLYPGILDIRRKRKEGKRERERRERKGNTSRRKFHERESDE